MVKQRSGSPQHARARITVSMCGAAYARGLTGPIEQVMCLLCQRMVPVIDGRIGEHRTDGPEMCTWTGVEVIDDRPGELAGGVR
ncbi:hypothetical protein [Nocardia abscessus]|uniref:hypothetical protein n=1 Tax=Nocardia abscessus TaxID=120957 RepID=UPI0024565363|nr:hypothetical protein [Nocardia abscessus]